MIRDDDSTRQRYGYMRRNDIPVAKDPGSLVTEKERGGLLRVAGDFALFAVGTVVGGAMLRSSGRSILSGVDNFLAARRNSQWLGGASKTFASLKNEGKELADILKRTEGIAGEGKRAVSYFDFMKDSEKFTSAGINPDYLKRLTVSRAAAYARRAPYELPAAYITQRYAVDRERTKKEIQEGRFNPLNPIDTIGDFTLNAASFVAGDVALHTVVPMGKAFDEMFTKTNKNYMRNKAMVKLIGSQATSDLLKMSNTIGAYGKTTMRTIGEIAEERMASIDVMQSVGDQTLSGVGVTGRFRRARASVIDAGKRIAANLQDEHRNRRLFGDAKKQTNTAVLGGDLARVDHMFGDDAAIYHDSLFGSYTENMQARLIGFAGDQLDTEQARNVVDVISRKMNRREVASNITGRFRSRGGQYDSSPFRLNLDEQWDKEIAEVLGHDKISGIQYRGLQGHTALNRMIEESVVGPTKATAGVWVSKANRSAREFQTSILKELLDQQGRAKLDLTKMPGGSSRAAKSQLDNMAVEAFDSLGVDPWSMTRGKDPGDVWGAWSRSLTGIDDVAERTRTFLVSRGKAFDTPFGDYNMLGLRRLTARGMISVENERQRTLRGVNTRFGKNASMFGVSPRKSFSGLSVVEREFGSLSTQRMLGDKGLYTNMTGDVVDVRGLFDLPYRALGYLEANTKIPIVGFNPLQMFGVGDWVKNRNVRIKHQIPRGNTFERRSIKGLDIDQPMIQVGKRTYGSVEGKVGYVGDFTWLSADATSLTTSIMRQMSGVPNEQTRQPSQRRGFFGGRWMRDRAAKIESASGHGTPQSTMLKKVADAIDWMDFEQSADKSIVHKAARRIGRSSNLKYKAAALFKAVDDTAYHGEGKIVGEKIPRILRPFFGDVDAVRRKNGKFLPHAFKKAIEKSAGGIALDEMDTRALSMIEESLKTNWDAKTASMMAVFREQLGMGPAFNIKSAADVDTVNTALTQMRSMLDSEDLPSTMRSALRRHVDRLEKLTGDAGIDPMHMDLSVAYGQSADKADRVFHQITQGINEFYLTVARAGGQAHQEQFDALWIRVTNMRQRGMISEAEFQKLRSTMAAVEIRVGQKTSAGGGWLADAGEGVSKSARRVGEALGQYVGPSTNTHETLKTVFKRGYDATDGPGGVVRGLKSAWESTAGNKGWWDVSGTIVDNDPRARNPFKGQKWIGIPSFTSRVGLDGGLKELSSVLTGKTVINTEENGSNPLRAIAGSMLGDTKFSDTTSATLAGTHLVKRIAEASDTIGLGLQGYKYKNATDLLMRGIMLKRAVPAVLGLAALDTLEGVPGIGKAGAMGAVATALGPGLGMVRSYAGEATGANWLLNQFSEVTDQDEDSLSRKLSRSPEEEWRYWTEGTDPIRQGRFWALGNTRWKGGKINYYRPNWWRTYMSDYKYNDTSAREGMSGKSLHGSRLERLMFGHDFSPLRVIDPYHYERKHYDDRPYPVSGDYFTGPWGPVTGIANATLGSILKPKKLMHTEDVQGLGEALVAQEAPLVMQAYASGRLNIGTVAKLGYAGYKTADAYIEKVNKTASRSGGRGMTVRALVRNSAKYADQVVNTSATGGATGAIVNSMNKMANQPSGSKYIQYTGQGSTGEGFIPAPFAYIMGKRPYQKYAEDAPVMSQAMKPGLLNYRMGEIGYLAQEWGGFYGFMSGSVREMLGGERDFSPKRPVMQSADRMYGTERAFWDLDLGGLGDIPAGPASVQLSEITRRFIPHKRNQMQQVNEIPNTMPDWMPGADDVINYQVGDPYVKQKLGEMRMPGAGYEAINRLHPDAFGSYGAFDRFKILADLAPWSSQYNQYKKLLEKSDLDDGLRKQVTEIKRQVAQRRKKIALSEKMWSGRLGTVATGEIGMSEEDPNLFIMSGQQNPIRLAGVRFSKDEAGKAQAKAFYETYLKGKQVKVKADKNGSPVLDNREKTLDAVVIAGGHNINRMLLDKIQKGEIAGTESQSKNFVDNMVRYSPAWQMLGRVWETIGHAEVPIIGNKLGRLSAAEHYERKMVYGKQWQPWETPIRSYLQPMWDTYTRDRGPLSVPIGAALTGWAAGMFFQGRANQSTARIVGALVGGLVTAKNQIATIRHGQRTVPGRRKAEWAMDEYFDVLQYIKSSREYKIQRDIAIKEEGVDPETIIAVLGESAFNRKEEFQKEWDAGPIGRKPQKPAAKKIFESIGPATAAALTARRRLASTMHGFDLSDDFMAKTAGIPKRFQPLMEGWLQTPKNERKKLLDIMPRAVRRIMEDQWGMPVEKGLDLTEYFKTHELPGPDWEGWLPEVNLDEIKMKVVEHEGLDSAEFGYYPNQINDALAQPWSYPDPFDGPKLHKSQIIDQLSAMGVMDVSVREEPSSGVGQILFNLKHDRTSEVANRLRGALA